MPRWIIHTLVCVGIVAAGLLLAVAAVFLRSEAGASASPVVEPERPAANVRVRIIEPERFEDRLLLTGRLEPWHEVTLSAEIGGAIESLTVDEGDTVEASQELASIDRRTAQAMLAESTARLRLATQELERLQLLREEGLGTPQEIDRAQAEFDIARTMVASAEVQLGKSMVRAPFDATVDAVLLEQNEFIDVGMPLLRLVQVDRLKAVVGIPERDVQAFSDGDRIELSIDGREARPIEGRIHRIAISAERTTRTFPTEIEIDNADQWLRPGLTVRARLVRKVFEQAVIVPVFSVITFQNEYFVAVDQDGIATLRPVDLGQVQGDRVHVRNGLDAGDRLIVAGHRQVRAGQPIQVQDLVTE